MAFPTYMNEKDAKVCRLIIGEALKKGWKISVNDGEEWVVKQATDRPTIEAAMASTDMDELRFRNADKQLIGTAVIIYGNQGECLSDYASTADMDYQKECAEFEDLMERAMNLIDRLVA